MCHSILPSARHGLKPYHRAQRFLAANGVYLGITPVLVTELAPSTAEYSLQLNGYEAATASVTVAEDQTNDSNVTLISLTYLGSMRTARQDMAVGNYQFALNSLEQALSAKPGDADALNLQTKAKGRELVQEAKNFASQSNYSAAEKKLQAALEIVPDDTEATTLLARYKSKEAEVQKLNAERQQAEADRRAADAAATAEKQREERLNRPHDYFVKLMSETPNSADAVEAGFEGQRVIRPDFRMKIADALSKSLMLKFTIEQNEEPFAGGFMIRAKLPMIEGYRRCYIVGGQTSDGEVSIMFKVMEYAWPPDLALGALLNRPSEDKAIPLKTSQINMSSSIKESRRALGIKIVTETDSTGD